MKGVWFFVLVLGMSAMVLAESSVTYTIVDETVLGEIRLDPGTHVVILPIDSELIEVNSDYTIEEGSLGTILVTEATKIDYRSESQLEKGDTSSFFVSRNPLEAPTRVVLVLPERATFSEGGLVFPKEYVLSTNGENIIVTWESVSDELLLEYSHPSRSWLLGYTSIIVIAIVLFLVYFLYVRRRFSQKTRTANLYRDEKRIIDYLSKQKDKSCWTKDLVKNLEMSKVTLSRKLRILEEKGLVTREPYGNENRVRLKK